MALTKWLICLIVTLHLGAASVHGSSQQILELLKQASRNTTLDELHRAVLADQQANYIEPIKSLHTRRVISLNGLYDFCFDPHTQFLPNESWAHLPLGASCKAGNLYRMPVPAAFNEILSNETAKNYMGWMWYQRVVALPPDRAGPRMSSWLIQLGSINYVGLIWAQLIDDSGRPRSGARLLGSHVGGHLPVVVNASELVHSASPHTPINLRLTIAVSNLLNENTVPSGRLLDMTDLVGHRLVRFEPDFDFFHFAGIMGDVQLILLPRHYIKRAYVANTYQQTEYEFTYCVAGAEEADAGPELLYEGAEAAGVSVDERSSAGECARNKFNCLLEPSGRLCQSIRQLDEWPHQGAVSIRLRVFMREAASGKRLERDVFDMKLTKRPTLERLMAQSGGQLQGFGMHHEQLFSGRSMSLPAIRKDLELLKAMGANVLRTSHYPYSEAYLEACDELGIMVIAECAAVGLRSFSGLQLELHKESLREMMLRDHEHASIVMWSVANEPASEKREARAYFQEVLHYARNQLAEFTLNAARPLTAALAQSHEADRIGDLLDLIMVNRYYAWYEHTATLETIRPALNRSLLGWARRYGKPVLLSEFGADALAGLHSAELFSEQFQRDLIEQHERVFDELAAARNQSQLDFLGALVWNFADFSTHQSLLRLDGNKKGVFTADRRPKMAAESVRRIFRRRAGLEAPSGSFRAEL